MPTVEEIIDIAKLSQPLAANYTRKRGLYGGGIDRKLPRLLYMVRKTVEHRFGQDPDDTTLQGTANYLYALCAPFNLEAQRILNIGSGGSIAPVTPADNCCRSIYPMYIRAADLDEDGNYNNSEIVGDNLIVFFQENDEKWHRASTDWFEYTPNGIKITAAYDETYTWVIQSLGESDSHAEDTANGYNYFLTENDTLIENVTVTTDLQTVTFAIKPNGFTYNWDTIFAFNDTYPEQPAAIGENTIQLYTFRYSAAIQKLICIAQALNTTY